MNWKTGIHQTGIFVPKNTTCKLQPADAGIIHHLKAKYRKRLVTHTVSLLNGKNTASSIIKQVTVSDVVRWLKASCDEVKDKSTIRNCFKKCGFLQVENMKKHEEHEEAQDDAQFQDLFQLLSTEVTGEEYLSFNDDVETP